MFVLTQKHSHSLFELLYVMYRFSKFTKRGEPDAVVTPYLSVVPQDRLKIVGPV